VAERVQPQGRQTSQTCDVRVLEVAFQHGNVAHLRLSGLASAPRSPTARHPARPLSPGEVGGVLVSMWSVVNRYPCNRKMRLRI
jgi:hypothetical protein